MAKRRTASVVLVVAVALTSSLSACGDDPPAASGEVLDAGQPQTDAAETDGTIDAPSDTQTSIDANTGEVTVDAKLVEFRTLNAAVGRRKVDLVDARGKKFQDPFAVSSFRFTGVLPPYDVKIGLPNEPASNGGTAWLGVTRKDPTFHTTDIFPAGGTYKTATFNMVVQAPPCAAAYCEVRVAAFSFGARGSGGMSWTYYPNQTTVTVPAQYSWYYTLGDPPLSITLDVLVTNPTFSTYYYERLSAFNVVPDDTRTIGAFPVSVPNIGNFTVVSTPIDIPADWTRRTGVTLTFPLGGSVPLAIATADNIVSGIPNIAGATVTGSSFGNAPPPSATQLYENSRSDSVALPISTTSAALTLARGPTMINPKKGLTTSLQVLTWANHPSVPQAKLVRLYNVTEKVAKAEAYVVGEQSIAFKRFVALGWTITPGEYSFSMATSAPFSSMDELVAPNAEAFYGNAARTSAMDFMYTYAP